MTDEQKPIEQVLDNPILGETKGKDESNVTLPKEVFAGIMERLTRLEKGGGIVKPKRITEREVRIKTIDNKPVAKVGRVISKDIGTSAETNNLEVFILEMDGSLKKKTVPYLDFLNNGDYAMAKIISQKATKKEDIQGYTRPEHFDLGTGATTIGSNEVPLVVTTVTYEIEVEVLNGELIGKKFIIDQSALNI